MASQIAFGLILALSLILVVDSAFYEHKVCWEECQEGEGVITSAGVEGCRRRRPQVPGTLPRFWCDGMTGPPCTMKRGDTVHLELDFNTGQTLRSLLRSFVGLLEPFKGLLDPSGSFLWP